MERELRDKGSHPGPETEKQNAERAEVLKREDGSRDRSFRS